MSDQGSRSWPCAGCLRHTRCGPCAWQSWSQRCLQSGNVDVSQSSGNDASVHQSMACLCHLEVHPYALLSLRKSVIEKKLDKHPSYLEWPQDTKVFKVLFIKADLPFLKKDSDWEILLCCCFKSHEFTISTSILGPWFLRISWKWNRVLRDCCFL